MYRTKRVKRDTVENIYQQCKISGNCPPDVVNKVEQTTLADLLLKIFGSVIYLGGLGIGTGSGVGASSIKPIPEALPIPEGAPTNEIPLEELPSVTRPSRPSRPTTFGTRIDPISSATNRPRPVNPRGPAIVPLSEDGLPEPAIIGGGASNGYEVLTNVDAFEDLSTVTGHPTVLHGQEDVAVLEVTPVEGVSHRTVLGTSTQDDIISIIDSSISATTETINVFVNPDFGGVEIGEEIELSPINTIQEFEIEEQIPRESTPSRIFNRTLGRARQLYNRIVEQAPTRNIDFLGQPSRAILFEYDNPAFSDDVTLTFERDLQEVAAAPDPTFTDVIQLQKPQFAINQEGLVRFSRLGTRGKISTRSGTILKQKVHFYYDLSPIAPVQENIELNVFQDSSDAVTIVDELSSSTFINPLFEENLGESALIDDLNEVFENAHLALIEETEEDQIIVPTLVTDSVPKFFSNDYFSKFSVINSNESPPMSVDEASIYPAIQIDPYGSDYYLHPSLMKRRKRKYSDLL
ncbi:L2 [Human papillomavirus]|uniref:Minor capsid protein L2 n=1 Tax=Human papillomavirus TaxID=10566 RepID=A0A0K1YWL0_9PAPI|nr:L2 [Human papillomavirus]AKZ17769.1 L2 [Human papillomavirus]